MPADTERDIARGYPPEAHRVVCVDFDGVLFPFGHLNLEPDPIAGSADAVRRLKAAGYRIVILTSRLSPRWLTAARYLESEQRDLIERLLTEHDIPFDEVTAEKVPAEAYLDDRAYRVNGNLNEIVDWILWSEGESA